MLRVASFSLYLLVAFIMAPCAAGSGTPPLTVAVKQRVVYHPKDGRLTTVCRSSWDAVACTDFPKEQLFCDCVPDGDAWRIRARAELEAVIHTIDAASLKHELLHLKDVRTLLPDYLTPRLSFSFSTKEQCDRHASLLSNGVVFRDVMNRVRALSNARMRCSPRTERARTLAAAAE